MKRNVSITAPVVRYSLFIDPTVPLDVNGAARVRTTTRLDGNVGIGQAPTANPLDVSGAARISTFLGVAQAPPSKARISATAATNDAAYAVVASRGKAGIIFDSTGNYGFLDYPSRKAARANSKAPCGRDPRAPRR